MWLPWWPRHGAMDPFEGTLFKVNADWPTSEFTHFNLVICLSIVNSPLFYDVSPLLPSLRTLGQFRFCSSEAVRNSHKLSYSARATEQLQGSMKGVRFMPAGVVFWWYSGEVEHIVHLIRLNLNSYFSPCGLTDFRPLEGVTHDSLG